MEQRAAEGLPFSGKRRMMAASLVVDKAEEVKQKYQVLEAFLFIKDLDIDPVTFLCTIGQLQSSGHVAESFGRMLAELVVSMAISREHGEAYPEGKTRHKRLLDVKDAIDWMLQNATPFPRPCAPAPKKQWRDLVQYLGGKGRSILRGYKKHMAEMRRNSTSELLALSMDDQVIGSVCGESNGLFSALLDDESAPLHGDTGEETKPGLLEHIILKRVLKAERRADHSQEKRATKQHKCLVDEVCEEQYTQYLLEYYHSYLRGEPGVGIFPFSGEGSTCAYRTHYYGHFTLSRKDIR